MPELPEVETVASDLRPLLVGKSIVRVELRFPSIVRHPEPFLFESGLLGRRIEALTRRGKYILMHLATAPDPDGEGSARPQAPVPGVPAAGPDLLVVHLGMTGQLRYLDPDAPLADHTHAVLGLDDHHELRYRDVRRFGRLLLGSEEELVAERKLPRLGPEPIDPTFSAADLYRRLHRRRAPLKALLLDQAVVAGVGNIYADEALFRARLRPDRRADSLSRPAARRLREALNESLLQGISNRGSSVDDYRDAWGEKGLQQERLQVYGRAGQPCFNCGRPLASIRLAGRSTVFCRRCQR